MLKMYNTDIETNITTETTNFKKGNWINMINPTESEISSVCTGTGIKVDFIKYSLDYEEKARIDVDDDGTVLFIIDIPIIDKENDIEIYTTMPVGVIFVRDEYIITVSLKENKIIRKIEFIMNKKISTYKKSKLLFQIFYENSSAYLNMLKIINKKTEKIEKTLKKNLKNEELLKMLNLEKSLVYITTSLKSNEIVMEKTLRGKIIKLYEEDEDLLEDAIIENKQAIEMSKIYSDILNETMDMYASIISNNINDVMKFLTSIVLLGTRVDMGTIKSLEYDNYKDILNKLADMGYVYEYNNCIYFPNYNLLRRNLVTAISPIYLNEVAQDLFAKVLDDNSMPSTIEAYLYGLLKEYDKEIQEWKQLAEVNLSFGDFSAYINCAERILKLLDKNEDTDKEEEIEEIKSDIYEKISENLFEYTSDTAGVVQQALASIEKSGDTDKIVQLCNKMIDGAINTGDYNHALDLMHKVLSLLPLSSINPEDNNFNKYFFLMSVIHIQILFQKQVVIHHLHYI